jgi:type III restriction enzyme
LAEYVGKTKLNRYDDQVDDTAFIKVLASLNPVVIIDESHNFKADLRVEALRDINPRFILDLTATPRNNSNIISIVDSMKLKRENMVKLPVIVYNHHTTNEVLVSAIKMQRTLESLAIEQEKNGGRYIRPIVLLQAQSRTSKESTDYQKIKEQLLEIGVPDEQIKIKTGDKDEIKDMDLLSRDCKVRFIITVNALKEGWDCPFAYVLASIANRSSAVDVEQILGRILRQPYTEKQRKDLLNLCYVFTSSNDFNATISNIIKSLNHEGFSNRDYRLAQPEQLYQQKDSPTGSEVQEQLKMDIGDEPKEPEINVAEIKEMLGSSENEETINTVIEAATEQSRQFNEKIEEAQNDELQMTAPEIMDKKKHYPMKETFKESAKAVCLPVFKKRINIGSIFEEAGSLAPLTKGMLAEGFDLRKADRNIDFTRAKTEAVAIDIAETGKNDYAPEYQKLSDTKLQYIQEAFKTISTEGQREQLAKAVAKKIRMDEVSEPVISDYVKDVVKDFDSEQVIEMYENLEMTAQTIREKISSLLMSYERSKFIEGLDTGDIICDAEFTLKPYISPLVAVSSMGKSLYRNEGDMDRFEQEVITEVAKLDNVVWWHRNLERGKGFYINAYINHYPDFIVKLKNGMVVIIETKGDHLDNTESKRKLEVGKKWASSAGNNYRYFMVFDKVKMDEAITVKELLSRIEAMR